MHKLLAFSLGLAMLAGCSPQALQAVLSQMKGNQPGGVPTAGASALPTVIGSALPVSPSPGPQGCAHLLVGLRWGHFPASAGAANKTWAGHIQVENGLVRIIRPIRFEGGDRLVATGSRSHLAWSTDVGSDFDGVLAVIVAAPGAPEPVIRIKSDVFGEQTYSPAALDGFDFSGNEDGQQFQLKARMLPPRPDACRDFDNPQGTSDVALNTGDLTVEQNQEVDSTESTLTIENPNATPSAAS